MAGLTKQNVGRILNDTPHWQTGKPPKASEAFVDSTASALGIDIDEAREAAGFSAKNPIKPPTNLRELIEALERLGLPVPQLHGGFNRLLEDSGTFEEALKRIQMDLELLLTREGIKVTHIELPIADDEEQGGQEKRKTR